jgi:hypothetical protein
MASFGEVEPAIKTLTGRSIAIFKLSVIRAELTFHDGTWRHKKWNKQKKPNMKE